MYGVPKFREGFFMKYRKEVLLSVGAFLTIATVVKFTPSQSINENKPEADTNQLVIEEVMDQVEEQATIGYQVVINGLELGLIADENDIEEIQAKAYEKLTQELGYEPTINAEPALIPVTEGELALDTSLIVDKLKDELFESLDFVMQQAYVMRIGDDFTIALENEEAVKEVLVKAQQHFIHEDVPLEIDLNVNEYNSMVLTPKVLMKAPDEGEISLSTAALDDEEEMLEDLEEATREETQDESEEEVEPGTMVAVEFAEEIAIVETFVNPEDIVDIQTATELITKENEEEKIYLVEKGDSPSTIAYDNGMKLNDLYKMNPGLKEKATSIHIGDPIVVMVPEPEIKVETKVEIVYTEAIERKTVFVDDPDNYVSKQTPVQEGSDGTLEVTALVTKLNGEEIDREIIGTSVITEPVDRIIAKGSKAFPVKGATGSYIFPVSGYRISSKFGYRWGSFHHGVDLALASGNQIWAADGGTVIFAGWKSSTYGYFVEIDHGNGVTTRYAHCSKVDVVVGQQVAKGEAIARVGSTGRSTGPHVHFEIRFDGEAANPLDYLE